MKELLTTLFILGQFITYAQDTIINKLGEKTIAQIIDTSGDYITYIPISTIHKDKVAKVLFVDHPPVANNEMPAVLKKETRDLPNIIGKGNKVYVSCKDAGGRIHTINALESWGFWEVTEDITKCDFILKMEITLVRKAEAHISLISQNDNSVLLDVPKSWVLFADYGNPKRAAIAKNFKEKFIPIIEEKTNSNTEK
jgi:hypothetical protein